MLTIANSLVNVDPGLFIWIVVTFVTFIFLLSKFAWKPILNALQEREKNIEDSIESAKKALEKAEQISKSNEQALRDAEAHAKKLRQDAAAEAELIRADRIEKARQEAENLIAQARVAIEKEKKQALQELRNEVAKLAIESASKILDAELDVQKNTKLVDSFINDLAKN